MRNPVKLRLMFHLQIWDGELTESHLGADNIHPSGSALFTAYFARKCYMPTGKRLLQG